MIAGFSKKFKIKIDAKIRAGIHTVATEKQKEGDNIKVSISKRHKVAKMRRIYVNEGLLTLS